jgi:hypothetical protein
MPNPSTTVKQGQPAPPADPDCVELDNNNIKARQEIIDTLGKKKKKTKADKRALKKAKGKGMTVASVKSTVPGAQGTMTTSSDGTANAIIPNQQCGGGTSQQKQGLNKKTRESKAKRHDKKKAKAGVLCDNAYVHPGGGKGAHSETKAVNCLTNMGSAMRGGSMTFKINWRSRTLDQGDESGMPCPDCYAMMCHAAIECGIKIFICSKDNQKEELSKEDCKKKSGYRNLSQRVDGNPTPGVSP